MKFVIVYKHLEHAIGWEMGSSLGQGFESMGHEVYYHGDGHVTDITVKEMCNVVKPEALIIIDTHDEYDVSDITGITKIFWSVDSHVLGHQRHINYINRNGIDIVLCSSFRDPNIFSAKTNAKVMWFPNAANTFKQKNLLLKKKYDVGFCGTMFPNRMWMSNSGWIHCERELHRDMVIAINRYKISINQTISYDINTRIFETMACGTPLLTNVTEGIIDLIGNYASYFSNPNEARDQAENLLSLGDEKLKKMGRDAMMFCIERHSYIERAKTIIESL